MQIDAMQVCKSTNMQDAEAEDRDIPEECATVLP